MNHMAPINCPQCGEELERHEDGLGVSYQCRDLSCLGFFEAYEVEEVKTNFKPPKKVADKKYIECVKQLPCVICEAYGEPYGQAPSDAHHPICGRFSQAKAPDHTVIPLCKGHHQTGEHGKPSVHGHRLDFVEAYGPDSEYIDVTRDRVFTEFGYTPKGFKQ